MKKKILYVLLIVILIFVDQIVKMQVIVNGNMVFIKNVIDITYVENTGGAFSLGAGNINVFIIINLIIFGIIIFLFNYTKQFFTIPSALILAGGISNFLDRIFRGFVIDYIDINNIVSFPVFNIADILIVVGAVCFVINLIGVKK